MRRDADWLQRSADENVIHRDGGQARWKGAMHPRIADHNTYVAQALAQELDRARSRQTVEVPEQD